MTREESISMALKLSKDYQAQEKILNLITDHEKRIARPLDESVRHYSVFDFFNKYLAASFIVTFTLAIPTYIFCAVSEFLYKSGNPEYANSQIKGILFLVIVFALIHLFGGISARKKRDASNESAQNTIRANVKLKEELKKDIADLRIQYDKNQEELEKYNDLVPEDFRNSVSMNRLKALLLANEAEDFEAGIAHIQNGRV